MGFLVYPWVGIAQSCTGLVLWDVEQADSSFVVVAASGQRNTAAYLYLDVQFAFEEMVRVAVPLVEGEAVPPFVEVVEEPGLNNQAGVSMVWTEQ